MEFIEREGEDKRESQVVVWEEEEEIRSKPWTMGRRGLSRAHRGLPFLWSPANLLFFLLGHHGPCCWARPTRGE